MAMFLGLEGGPSGFPVLDHGEKHTQKKVAGSQAPLTSNGEVGRRVGELQPSLLQGRHVQEQAFSLWVQVIPH